MILKGFLQLVNRLIKENPKTEETKKKIKKSMKKKVSKTNNEFKSQKSVSHTNTFFLQEKLFILNEKIKEKIYYYFSFYLSICSLLSD